MSKTSTAAERFINAMNTGNLEEMEEFIAPDFHQVMYGFPDLIGLDGAKGYVTMLRSAFPDLEQTIDDIVATDDKIAFRATLRGTHTGALRTIAPTGNRIEMPYHVFAEVVDGKLTRTWVVLDKMEYLQQLGVLPRPEE